MSYTPKANSGAIFKNNKPNNDKSPQFIGDLYLSKELLEDLLKNPEELIKLSISSWEKQTSNGNSYYTLLASKPYIKSKEEN